MMANITLDDKERQLIVKEAVEIIRQEYDLPPKHQNQLEQWAGIQEFTNALPVKKDKEWVRMFILQLPEFKNWVFNLNAGKGHRVKVNLSKGLNWVAKHQDEIDWNQPLPR